MTEATKQGFWKTPIGSVTPFFAIVAVLLFVLPVCSMMWTEFPSFVVSVVVSNHDAEQFDLRVKSPIADETITIMPGDERAVTLFSGDHGDEFDVLTSGTILIEATDDSGRSIRYEIDGSDLLNTKRPFVVIENGEMYREANQESIYR